MNLFSEVADIKTADTLDLPRPKANYQTIIAKPTEHQRALIEELSRRAAAIHRKLVSSSVDNMLVITSDGRKIGIDQRMIDPNLPDFPESKVNLCMNNVFDIWSKTTEKRSTQLIFCDFSTPNKDGRFNVYDDIRGKLIAKGIPKEEIAFIHDYNTEAQKKDLFIKMRSGKIRILFGSTAKCGAGTNIQDKLIALHDLDAPWRPSDLAQRAGRIERQGNENPEVDIFRYVTEATFDAYLFQTIENKQKFISQVMTSKSPVRTCDDLDGDALSYAEVKALCAGNPIIAEKMNLDIEVGKLKMLKADHQSQHYHLEDNLLQKFPKDIEYARSAIKSYKADIAQAESSRHTGSEGISPMRIGESTFTDRKDAGEALLDILQKSNLLHPESIGKYRGFDMIVSYDVRMGGYKCTLKGANSHDVALGTDPVGNIQRIDNALEKIPSKLQEMEESLKEIFAQIESAKEELAKPFPREEELATKSARLAELDTQLSLDATLEGETVEGTKAASSQVVTMLDAKTTNAPEVNHFVYTPKRQATTMEKTTANLPTPKEAKSEIANKKDTNRG